MPSGGEPIRASELDRARPCRQSGRDPPPGHVHRRGANPPAALGRHRGPVTVPGDDPPSPSRENVCAKLLPGEAAALDGKSDGAQGL